MKSIQIITIFPDVFKEVLETSIIGRAKKKDVIDITVHDLRKWTSDNHKTVDERPFGGGAGMLMTYEPIQKALLELDPKHEAFRILTSPRGKLLKQNYVRELSKKDRVIILCGHYEGVDQRVSDNLIDAELSIGEYILSGGEVASMVIVDSITRLLDESLGNPESLTSESFDEEKYIEYDQYTRPEVIETKDGKKLSVPEVLLSGNHANIEKWKQESAKRNTEKYLNENI
ncbi:MAG: tRNA (guanosine(37)-N1)-methyltransferase TrmD [bacterium]